MHAFCQAKDLQKGAQILASDDQSLLEAGEFHGRICFYHIWNFDFRARCSTAQKPRHLWSYSNSQRKIGDSVQREITLYQLLSC